MQRFEGKAAVITGGARGIGRVIAEQLADEGAAVGILSLREESARKAAAEINARGGTAIGFGGDVAVEGVIEEALRETVRTFGRLDVMINNAGAIGVGSLVEIGTDEWDRVIAVNLRGAFFGCREAARHMIAQGRGGRILNCGSTASRRGEGLLASYSASKFAIIGLTQALAVELAPHRITVNAYCPGHVTTTPMWDFLDAEYARVKGVAIGATKNAVSYDSPLNRVGNAEEIAAAVAFLASDDSSFITGESLLVDGGITRH